MLSLFAPADPTRGATPTGRDVARRARVRELAGSLRGVSTGAAGGGRNTGTGATGDLLARLRGGPAGFAELVAAPGAPPPWGFALAVTAGFRADGFRADGFRADGRGGAGVVAVVAGGGTRGLPAAWAALGVGRAVLIRPGSERDRLWAIERCLRCPGLAATVAFLPAGVDPVTGRRLALAAAAGGGRGVLVRPAGAGREPCWADVRLEATPASGPGVRDRDTLRPRWHVRAVRRRGAVLSDELERGVTLELTDDARLVPVAAGLAGAADTPGRGGSRPGTRRRERRGFARAG